MKLSLKQLLTMMLCVLIIPPLLYCLFRLDAIRTFLFASSPENSLHLSRQIISGMGSLLGIMKKYLLHIATGYAFLTAAAIFLEEKNPDRTLAWIMALILLPFIGLLLYFMFGPDVHRRSIFKEFRKRRRHPPLLEQQADYEIELFRHLPHSEYPSTRTVNLLLRNSRTPVTLQNEVQLLINGQETFDSIKRDLREARKYIHMEYFSIANDRIGNEIKDILIKKAREGLCIRLIYDSVGSWQLGKKYVDDLRKGGVQVAAFLPVSFPMARRRQNYRNHRKIITVDGHIGFMGGLNLGDKYLGRDTYLGFWRDTHIRLEGEAVHKLQDIFVNDWNFCTRESIYSPDLFPASRKTCGELPIQIATSGPDSNWKAILQGYFSLISSAHRRLWITTPYLVPEASIMMALCVAALSGVDVRIIIPGKADHRMVFWASRSNLDELLQAGVHIYSYQNGFIHSKIVIVDDETVSVGSANMDSRSLEINFEVQAFIYDKETTKKFEREFDNDLRHCQEFNREERRQRPFRERVLEAWARLWSSQI